MKVVAQEWGGGTLRHETFADGSGTARAAAIIFPTVVGVSDLERGFAERLVGRGHSVLIADLYGRRFTPGVDREAAFAAMGALQSDRAAMRELLIGVLVEARAQDEIDSDRIVAIGFCFGGQCALDLARSGVDIAGVASFHGLLDPPGLPPRPIKARVIAFHGWDDPLARPDSVAALGEELTAAGCDWQIHGFGGVGHGFTNPGATGAIPGIQYHEAAARRSWAGLDQFLGEIA